ncbi:helix-turn-helix domain-containing transcriptional regulator [Mesorhizobium sp. ASY16-5R]|uniref:helix-turn-helix domain-containing transcriptional regulator n=1 Tax=Mesorhizobium sp. ASY16-5R TaxID=3445772 RepID=UPI003F9EF9BF
MAIDLEVYEDDLVRRPFEEWFDKLPAAHAAKVTTALFRLGARTSGRTEACRPRCPGMADRLGTWHPDLPRLRWFETHYIAGRRDQEPTAIGYRPVAGPLGGLQASQTVEGVKAMALSRSFKETVRARAERDPEFRAALLGEAVEAFAAGEADVGKALMRDYINATVGFDQLGEAVSIDPKNLMRMFGPRGNPRLGNLSAVLRELNRREAVRLKVEPERLAG